MNEREQAKELISKFMFAGIYFTDGDNGAKKNAKQCALICVDQLIKEHTWSSPISWNLKREKYWQAVKTEIQNFEGEKETT